jgi:hypothetical protein
MEKLLIPTLPIKKWALCIITSSLNGDNYWVFFCNKNSFNSYEEAWKYITENRNWNEGHSHGGINELDDDALNFYNEYFKNIYDKYYGSIT